MKVLHVIPSIAAPRGGPSYVVLRLARALAARGVSTEILTTRADLDATGEAAARDLLGSAVELSLVATRGPAQLETAPALIPALWRRLAEVDVVHVHTVFTFPAALPPWMCRAHHVAHIVRPAGTLDEDCLAMRSTRRKRLAVAAYVRRNLVGADAVQATSDKEARELRRLAPTARVVVLELGADAQATPSDSAGAGRRVGFLGRLHPTKQLEVLLRAMPLLSDDAELVLAGDGDAGYVAGLRELARSLGLGGRVRFLGHVDEAAKREFLAGCDVLASPSRHESFGVAVAEAMAAGRAVLVAPGVALAETITREGAGLVAEAEPAAFAGALQGLLSDGEGRAKMAEAGRQLARRRWSWDAIGDATLALYEDVLRRRRDADRR